MGQGLKQAWFGKYILKAIKSNSVIPPLFELGVENDHGIGSKTLLTEISKLGYAVSYDEVNQYKLSVSIDEDHKLDQIKDGFTHFVADNVDHNTDTLDGKGTFHGMHIIDCSVLNKYLPGKRVKRILTILIRAPIERKVSIKLHWYQGKDVRSLSKYYWLHSITQRKK